MKINTANSISRLIALVLGGLALSSQAWAASYTFTELAPLTGGAQSTAYGINNLGQVVQQDGDAEIRLMLASRSGETSR